MEELYTVFRVGLAAMLIAPAVVLIFNREAFEAFQVNYLQELHDQQDQKILDSIHYRN
jgi:uncharacterized protein YeaO (DUF488 family)